MLVLSLFFFVLLLSALALLDCTGSDPSVRLALTFDDPDNRFFDYSSYQRTVSSITGQPEVVSDDPAKGSSVWFKQTGQYAAVDGIDLGTWSAVVPAGDQFTIGAWVKVIAIVHGPSGDRLFCKVRDPDGTGFLAHDFEQQDWILGVRSGGFYARLTTSSVSKAQHIQQEFGIISGDGAPWYHAVMVYDGYRLRLYVDGTVKASMSLTGTVIISDGVVTLGYAAFHSNRGSNAVMDDVFALSTALTQVEVNQMMHNGFGCGAVATTTPVAPAGVTTPPPSPPRPTIAIITATSSSTTTSTSDILSGPVNTDAFPVAVVAATLVCLTCLVVLILVSMKRRRRLNRSVNLTGSPSPSGGGDNTGDRRPSRPPSGGRSRSRSRSSRKSRSVSTKLPSGTTQVYAGVSELVVFRPVAAPRDSSDSGSLVFMHGVESGPLYGSVEPVQSEQHQIYSGFPTGSDTDTVDYYDGSALIRTD